MALATRTLYIGCVHLVTACGIGASTDTYGHDQRTRRNDWYGTVRMGLNMNSPNYGNDIGLEEVLIHELQHFAGVDHDGDRARWGLDSVYACGRHLNFCRRGSFQSVMNTANLDSAYDCAECAEPERAHRCGDPQHVNMRRPQCIDDPGPLAPSCGSLVCPAGYGTSCLHTETDYCNFEPILAAERSGPADNDSSGCAYACPPGMSPYAPCAAGASMDSFDDWRTGPFVRFRCMRFADDQHACAY
jgi:hypothetical protein